MSNQPSQRPAGAATQKKQVSSTKSQIEEIEKQISGTKYNKSTQLAVGLLKAKVAALKEKEANKGKGQKKGEGYAVRKSGHATVVLLGFPSVGKSTLLNTLTNAKSEVAAYAFTTLTCIPGTLEYKHAKIQVLDLPGIVEGAAAGTGRGKEVLQVIRGADLIIMLLDVFHPEHFDVICREVRDTGIRMNAKPPIVKIVRTSKGGIDLGTTVKLTKIDGDMVKGILKEFGYLNASVVIREDIDADRFIDAIRGNCVYIPAITVINKIDLATQAMVDEFKRRNIKIDAAISAQQKDHIEELKEVIYNKLAFIKLYLKEIGKKPDMDEPLIIQSPCTLEGLCSHLHRDFVEKFKFARVWGTSVKFSGQKVLNLKHELADGDVIELHLR